MDLIERLGQLFASAIHDFLRGKCHDNCVLSPGKSRYLSPYRSAGQIKPINDYWGPEKDAGETRLARTIVLSEATSGKFLVVQPNTYEVVLMIELSEDTINYRGD